MKIDEGRIDWRIAEQHFSGTSQQVAAQLDELLLALVAMRQRLSTDSRRVPQPVSLPGTLRAE